MTFEAGRKKQLLVLQPRGKPLYEDTSSFGMKLMKSMGWEKGNGLGKNQQGNLNFIQVRYRNNANGLGFDGLKDNQWTQNESGFDDLLKNLNAQSNSNSGDEAAAEIKKPVKSLEEMSKKSRARVHYKKFTRGKDVYKYSEKDLANILGKKTLKEPKEEEVEEIATIELKDEPDAYKSDLIINTGISITDYFKDKIRGKEDISYNSTNESNELPKKKRKKQKLNEEIEESIQQDITAESEVNAVKSDESSKRKKKKKQIVDDDVVVEEEIAKSNEIQESKKSKKKKKESKLENEPSEEIAEIKQVNDEETKAKKKKKRKVSETDEVDNKNTATDNPKSKDNQPQESAEKNDSSNVVQISSRVAEKMSQVSIDNFKNANLGNIIGYGMSENITIKVVQTKMGENSNNNTDKYALYNMEKLTKTRVNPRKIFTKLKKTKKSIQVI